MVGAYRAWFMSVTADEFLKDFTKFRDFDRKLKEYVT